MINNTTLIKPWDEYPIEYINITKDEIDNLLSIDETIDIYLNRKDLWNSTNNLPGEVWTYVSEFGKRYSISCYGRLKQNQMSIVKKNYKGTVQRIDVPEKIINGYVLSRNKYPEHIFREEGCHYTIHRLVAKYFIKKSNPEFDFIDHKNTIKYCAHILNLWWCDARLNSLNPLTKRFQSTKIVDNKFVLTTDDNASTKDNIDDYLTLEKLFSPRMFTNIDFKGELWEYVQAVNLYVSNYGRLKRQFEDNTVNILKQSIGEYNYLTYASISVHYLVLYAFGKIDYFRKYEDNMTIDHINTKAYDNRLCNLRYVSLKNNVNNDLTRKHMSESYNKEIRSTRILLYDALTLKFVKEFESIQYASRELNTSSGTIKRTLDMECIYKNRWFMFKKETNDIKVILSKEDITYYNKKINKYDRDGNLICSYNNAFEIRNMTTVDDIKYIRSVYNICETKKGTFDNCQWRYTKDSALNIGKAVSHMTKYLKINMYDYDGNFIRQFENSKEISEYFKKASSGINAHINTYRKETVIGFYFRYIYIDNKQNLWDSGLFNNSENAEDILNISKERLNVIEETSEIINVYDASDGYIIKRYYSKNICADELNINEDLLFSGSIINQKYYILVTENNDNFEVRTIIQKENISDINNYISFKILEASDNAIIVYNYFTNERIGEFVLSAAEEITGIHAITIINCCDGLFNKAVNIKNLETYAFCYKKDEDDFEINNRNIDNRLFVLYNISDKSLYKVCYTQVELFHEIGYRPSLNKNYSVIKGKYILAIFTSDEKIPNKLEYNKTITPIIDKNLNFSNQYYRCNDYKILKFSLDGEFIESFSTFAEISSNRTVRNKIRECARHFTKSAYGYQWRFNTECSETDNISPATREKRSNYGEIVKYTLNDEYIEEFSNIHSIPDKNNNQLERIHHCAMGRITSAYGFKWKYKNLIS